MCCIQTVDLPHVTQSFNYLTTIHSRNQHRDCIEKLPFFLIVEISSYIFTSTKLHQQQTNPLIPIFAKQSRMPLRTSNVECRRTPAITCQNKQQDKSKPKGKKIKSKGSMITGSCCAQPQHASTMNDELQIKSCQTKRRSWCGCYVHTSALFSWHTILCSISCFFGTRPGVLTHFWFESSSNPLNII